MPLNQTSHITNIEPGQKYEFKLVLYDGDVVVQSLLGPRIILKQPGKVSATCSETENLIFAHKSVFRQLNKIVLQYIYLL